MKKVPLIKRVHSKRIKMSVSIHTPNDTSQNYEFYSTLTVSIRQLTSHIAVNNAEHMELVTSIFQWWTIMPSSINLTSFLFFAFAWSRPFRGLLSTGTPVHSIIQIAKTIFPDSQGFIQR